MIHETIESASARAATRGGGSDDGTDVSDGAASDRGEMKAGSVTTDVLLTAFESLVGDAVREAGTAHIRDETELSDAVVRAMERGDVADCTVRDSAVVLGATTDRDADAIVAELRDHLLIGMATAVLDVDTIAASIETDLTGQEVQQALEGRTQMTLEQLAEISAVIEQRKR